MSASAQEKMIAWKALECKLQTAIDSCKNDEERAKLTEELNKLKSRFFSLNDTIDKKDKAFTMWTDYSTSAQVAEDKMRELEKSLLDGNLSPEEIEAIQVELAHIKESMRQIAVGKEAVEKMMSGANITFKDRATEKPVQIQTSVEQLLEHVNNVNHRYI